MAQQTEHRTFEEADEVREFPNGRAEILNVGGGEPVTVVDWFGASNSAR